MPIRPARRAGLSACCRSAIVSMSYQSALPMSTPRIRPSAASCANAAAQRRVTRRARAIDRREQRRRADEHAGVERVVRRAGPCRSRRSGRRTSAPSWPRPRLRRAPAASRPRGATRPARPASERIRASTAASNRWSPISSANRRSTNRWRAASTEIAVLEMPVGVVRKVHVQAGREPALDGGAQPVGLIAEDDLDVGDARVARGRERPEDDRFAEDRLKELGLPGSVVEAIAVAGGEHERVPDRDGRRCCQSHLESLFSPHGAACCRHPVTCLRRFTTRARYCRALSRGPRQAQLGRHCLPEFDAAGMRTRSVNGASGRQSS